MSWKNLFTGTEHAAIYNKFRPNYPHKLYRTILDYLHEKRPSARSQAVDVGCGSGQNTRALAQYFDQVLGTDVSEAQIGQARVAVGDSRNVQYRVGNFDNLYVDAGSTDLVTSALAAHWFEPIERFYTEVDRVLKPGGVLAIFAYGMPKVLKDGAYMADFTDIMWQMYRDDRMAGYKTGRQTMVEHHYKDFALPYPNWTRYDDMETVLHGSMADFLGYLSSWSFYRTYQQDHPDQPDLIEEVAARYKAMIGDTPLEEYSCTVSFPVFLLMGRKPV